MTTVPQDAFGFENMLESQSPGESSVSLDSERDRQFEAKLHAVVGKRFLVDFEGAEDERHPQNWR
jgi:hypothetical protein